MSALSNYFKYVYVRRTSCTYMKILEIYDVKAIIVAIGGHFLDHRCCFSGVINNVFCHINFSKKHGSHFPVHLSCRMCFITSFLHFAILVGILVILYHHKFRRRCNYSYNCSSYYSYLFAK